MKNNEAIEYLENLQCHAATEGECDALGMAISALRYTSTGEPLTLEQLREMDRKPVWVEFTGSKIERESGWFILKYMKVQEAHLVGKINTYKSYEYYGKTWVAYAYPPAHIDREAWRFETLINSVPSSDVAPAIYAKRIKTKKHRWKTYRNGEINFCAWDSGYCNGPQCIDCGAHFCIHCVEKDGGEDAVKQRLEKEDCEQKTVCSVCGRYVPNDAPYCHCGAKMDLE